MTLPKRFPDSFLDRLRSEADVVDVVGRAVTLKKAGKEFMGLCPFHAEKSPSFTVSPVKQFYHCFGCGAHGDALGFLSEYHGYTFVEAVEVLAGELGIPVPRSEEPSREQRTRDTRNADVLAVLARAKTLFYQNLRGHPQAVDYLKSRGLLKETVTKFGLGYAHVDDVRSQLHDVSFDVLLEASLLTTSGDTGEIYDKFRRRIMFPIQNEKGDVIGFGGRVLNDSEQPKYLNSAESAVFQKGDELYGLNFAKQEIRRSRVALVFEGYMDVIMLHQAGDTRAVAGLGTSLTERQLARLFKYCDTVVFCFDGDKAGRAAANRAVRTTLAVIPDGKSAKFLTLPPEHDPDSFVRAHGIEHWKALVEEGSTPLSVKILRMLTEKFDMDLPESQVAVAKEATELLAGIGKARTFSAALKAHLERKLGFALSDVAVRSSGSSERPKRVASRSAVEPIGPQRGRSAFYENFALLCALAPAKAEALPEELIDDFARLIAGWMAFAPSRNVDEMRRLNKETRPPALRDCLDRALAALGERVTQLSPDAILAEGDAVLAAIMRDAERQSRAAQVASLFK